jgi:alpha-tubulin suppressor-like RCC1 family protein
MDNVMVCFGSNLAGELGTATPTHRSTPVEIPRFQTWQSVSTGGQHACGIDANMDAWCWGWNRSGQLGNGETAFQRAPAQVDAGPWKAVSTGLRTTCALRSNDTVWCMGDNGGGELGDGTTARSEALLQVGMHSDWQAIAAGRTHTCGIRSGKLFCWGDNSNGELGLGSMAGGSETSPVQVGTGTTWTSVSAASSSTLALAADGLYYWGGANGLSSPSLVGPPTATFTSLTGFSDGFEGDLPTQAVLQGTDHYDVDQTGLHLTPLTSPPAWNAIAQGVFHTCGISGGAIYCFGENDSGQFGLMPSGQSTTQVYPSGVTLKVKAVAAGYSETCALTDPTESPANELYCWGSASVLPIDTQGVATYTAQEILPGASWSSVSLASEHGCGIETNGSLWCWGDNLAGEVGVGPASKGSPVRVMKVGP